MVMGGGLWGDKVDQGEEKEPIREMLAPGLDWTRWQH